MTILVGVFISKSKQKHCFMFTPCHPLSKKYVCECGVDLLGLCNFVSCNILLPTVNQHAFTNSNDQINAIPTSRSHFEDPPQRRYDHVCHDSVINHFTRCCCTSAVHPYKEFQVPRSHIYLRSLSVACLTHPPTRKRYCNNMFTPLKYQ